jgi:DNA polymerase III subunit delta'
MSERLAPLQHDTIDQIPEPSENPFLVGHVEASEQLAQAYRARRLHHGLMITGPVGIGKATLAFHLANHLLRYPDPTTAPETLASPDPAGPTFRQIAQGAHPSVLHLTRPYNDKTKNFRTAITVDEIRKVGRFLSMTAQAGAYRVVIVDAADDMNTNAANALLKNLEEPPKQTIFLILAHQPGRLLPTIRSRCQVVKLKPLEVGQIRQVIRHVGQEAGITDSLSDELLDRAGGSVREALMMTQYGGAEIVEALLGVVSGREFDTLKAWRIAEAVAGRDAEMAYRIFNRAILDEAARRAADMAGQGRADAAERLAALWEDLRGTIGETDTYNLDRKQHAMSVMRRLSEAA